MPTFIVNSAILRPSGRSPKACATGMPKMLLEKGIKNIKVKSCFCCSEEGRVAFLIEAANKDVILEALDKVTIPVASIIEAEEVKSGE